jgi:ABC-type uncharacterized transport system permease subunit
MRSAIIVIPGALIIGATYVPAALKILARREVKFLLAAVGLALAIFAVTN